MKFIPYRQDLYNSLLNCGNIVYKSVSKFATSYIVLFMCRYYEVTYVDDSNISIYDFGANNTPFMLNELIQSDANLINTK